MSDHKVERDEERHDERRELTTRAREWMQANDGGQLGVHWPAGSKPGSGSQPIMAVMWDYGGTGELGAFYDENDAEKMQLICDLANWAMAQLVPTEREYYGDRIYLDGEQ